jgi:hypothetical protein
VVWEIVTKQARQKFNVERFGLKNLNDVKAREQYQVDISNKLAALENVDDNEDINRLWENIRAGYFKHKILNQQMHYYYYYYYYYYYICNPCKPVQHVSIPFWHHHQGHL